MISRIRDIFRHDRGENSIMQVVVIAMIAISVTAGLVALPAVVKNSQAQGVRATVEALAKTEDAIYARSGKYVFTDSLDDLMTGKNGVKVMAQSGISLMVTNHSLGGGYAIYAKSQSGDYVYRSSLCNMSFFGTETFGQLRGGPSAQKDSAGRTFATCFPGIPGSAPPASDWYHVQ